MPRRPRMTVEPSETGWPSYIGGPPGICNTVLDRLRAGLPPCDELAIWEVKKSIRGGQYVGHYCDEHLPAEAYAVIEAEQDAADEAAAAEVDRTA